MATDANMDQPNTPPTFPEEAMDAITAKLREVEAALLARARPFGTGFYCASPRDSADPLEVLLDHRAGGIFIGCRGESRLMTIGEANAQFRLMLADAMPHFCAKAAEFYDRLATLRADDLTVGLDRSLARLAAPAQADMRGASMPRD